MVRATSRLRAVVLVGCAALATWARAGDPSPEPSPPPKPYGFRQLASDSAFLWKRPSRMDRRDRMRLAAVLGSAGGLFVAREEIREFVGNHRSDGRKRFLDGARTFGKGAFAPSLALVSYLASFGTHNAREKETTQLLLESAGYSALAAGAGQFVLASERPERGERVRWLRTGGHGVSMDAALAASVVPPLRCQYLRVKPSDRRGIRVWKRVATVLLYAGAGLTAYQRLYQDKHWAPDAFLGTMTGLTVGEILCEAHERRGQDGQVSK